MFSNVSNPRFSYGYVVAAAGFCIWFITWGTAGTFGIFFTPVSTEFGWSRADTALAYSLGAIVMSSVAVAMGWFTDKLGPRFVVTFFGSFLGISFLLTSQMNHLWQFLIYHSLISAIGRSTAITPIMATVARWFVRTRGLMIGIVQAGLGLGGFICAPLAGWLIVGYGWRSAYIILGIIALAGIIIPGLFLRRDPQDVRALPEGAKGIKEVSEKTINKETQDVGLPLRVAFRTGQFWTISGLYFSFGFCRTTFLTHTAPYVQDLGYSLIDGANVMAALALSSMIGRVVMGRAADVFGNRLAFMMSFTVTTIALIWVLTAKDLGGLYLFAFLLGFGWGAQAVLRFSLTSEVFGLASLGLVMGILGLSEAIASAFGAYFVGYIFDVTGNYYAGFWIGIALSIIGCILAWSLKPGNSPPQKEFLAG